MSRPSTPLLQWIRTLLDQKGHNTAWLAERAGLDRKHARRILAGQQDMTVDELLTISNALELDPGDFIGADALLEQQATAPAPTEAAPSADEDQPKVDPWGNQPQQLFQIAFALGCDFMFTVDTTQLEDSGVPGQVLAQYKGRELPIRLDAAYHQYNEPSYSDTGIQLVLSFDALYTCSFPWSAIGQFILFPVSPDKQAPPPEPEAPKGPHLRLVT